MNYYLKRKILAELGFTSPLSELTAERADELCLIDEIFAEEFAKKSARGKKRG